MSKIAQIAAYLLMSYPTTRRNDLSNARVTKMAYLADWKSTLVRGETISGISWFFDNYGPFVWDVVDSINEKPSVFELEDTENLYGSTKRLIRLKKNIGVPLLTREDLEILDHVIEHTSEKSWKEFIELVYSTYPVSSSSRYSYLDLGEKAIEYQSQPA